MGCFVLKGSFKIRLPRSCDLDPWHFRLEDVARFGLVQGFLVTRCGTRRPGRNITGVRLCSWHGVLAGAARLGFARLGFARLGLSRAQGDSNGEMKGIWQTPALSGHSFSLWNEEVLEEEKPANSVSGPSASTLHPPGAARLGLFSVTSLERPAGTLRPPVFPRPDAATLLTSPPRPGH